MLSHSSEHLDLYCCVVYLSQKLVDLQISVPHQIVAILWSNLEQAKSMYMLLVICIISVFYIVPGQCKYIPEASRQCMKYYE